MLESAEPDLASDSEAETCPESRSRTLKAYLRAGLKKVIANRSQGAVWIAAFQVVASFGAVYQIRWEPGMLRFMQYSSAANLDIFTIPGSVCMFYAVSLKTRVLVATLSPLAAMAVHALPLACVAITARMGCGGALSDSGLLALMQRRFWTSLVFSGIVLYSAVSISTLRPFQCHWELELATMDFTQPCPTHERGFVFYWSLFFTLLFPICIPASMLAALVLHGVPALARRKLQDAYLRGLLEYAYPCRNAPPDDATAYHHKHQLRTASSGGSGRNTDLCKVLPPGNGGASVPDTPLRASSAPSGRYLDLAHMSGSGSQSEDFACAGPLLLRRAELFGVVEQVKERVKRSGLQISEPDLDNMSTSQVRAWLQRVAERLLAQHEISVVEPSWNMQNEREQKAMEAVGGLFLPYKVKYWYWEQVEMLRKLVLTSVIPIFVSTTEVQITAGLLVIIVFFGCVLACSPYRSSALNLIQACLHLALFGLLYSARK